MLKMIFMESPASSSSSSSTLSPMVKIQYPHNAAQHNHLQYSAKHKLFVYFYLSLINFTDYEFSSHITYTILQKSP